MNYILLDLEFNQAYNKNLINLKCPFEIIQIGAVKLDENLQTISTFNRLIKPEVYTSIHPFIKKMTGISAQSLISAESFKKVYENFIKFIGMGSILSVWGMADIKELFRNAEYHSLDMSLIPREYINVQFYASKYLKNPKGTNVGLRNAVELFNIPDKNQFHNAFYDAYYTAEIFKKIFSNEIKPKIYNLNKDKLLNRCNDKKTTLDTHNLMKQFEKMFNREMTSEEQSIIKLAYIMGKTSQFQIEIPCNTSEKK
ncbi:3'-5' exonuclease [Clostridium lundense]|uniref:3'-5' exonuclease n=1 Tax=Clostridium lundense TaxID=319475 RepID=UPI000480EF51|nr:3'-5' exonuclease [Clostridium lundense]